MSLFTDNVYVMAFVGGGCGSIIAQMLSVPIDIVSQHMMLAGQIGRSTSASARNSTTTTSVNSVLVKLRDPNRIHVPDTLKSGSTISIAKFIANEIYKNENLKGFYRGYFLSTFLVSFNSALWWPFYYFYQGKLRPLVSENVPTLAVQCICGPLSSFSANLLTNP